MFTDVNDRIEGEHSDDFSGGPLFVGRNDLLEDIKTRLTPDRRLVQLYGQPMVGKARIAKKVQQQLMKEAEEKGKPLRSYEICCRGVSHWEDMLNNFLSTLDWNDVPCTESAILTKLKNIMKAKQSHLFLFAFLKCEDLGNENSSLSERFDTLITKLSEISKKVFIIVTTQKVFTFKGVKNSTIKIPPMTSEESKTLIKRCLSDVDVEPFLPVVESLCLGLPSLIIEAASQLDLRLSESSNVTSEDFEEIVKLCLESTVIHSSGSILRVFDGLDQTTKNIILDFSIFQGSFGIDQLATVFDKCSSQAKALVAKLEQCSQLVKDKDTDRLRIHPAVEHYVRNLFPTHVTHNDTVRLRFVKLFGQVLTKVDEEITVRPEKYVYQYLHPDWSNFQQLLKEAIHCTQDTYAPFLEVANYAETVLIKFFPEEALNFYMSMVEASKKFGNEEEQAKQKWLLGRAKTRGKGTEYDDALKLFKQALSVLCDSDDYYAHISLLADMAFNYYKQGFFKTAHEFYEQALEKAMKHESTDRLLNKVFTIRCDTATQLIFLNQPDRAETMLKETLEQVTYMAPHHPSIAYMINGLGLVCERARHDDENALRYYTSSLYVRRTYTTLAPADLVVALNNVGMQHLKRGNREYALKLLNEALSIRKKLGWKDYHTGLTCFHLGRVHMALLHFEEALEYSTWSLEIFHTCTKNHHVQIAVIMSIAHCLAGLNKSDRSLEYLKKAVSLSEMYQKQCPSDEYFILARKHLFVALQGNQEDIRYIFQSKKSEIQRQISECRKNGEDDKNITYHRQLLRLYEADKTLLSEDFNSGNGTNGLLDNCHICTALTNVGFNVYQMWRNVHRQVTWRTSLLQKLCSTEIKGRNGNLLNTNEQEQCVNVYANYDMPQQSTDESSSEYSNSGHLQTEATREDKKDKNTPNKQLCSDIQKNIIDVYSRSDRSITAEKSPYKQGECPVYKNQMILEDNLQLHNKTSCNTSSDGVFSKHGNIPEPIKIIDNVDRYADVSKTGKAPGTNKTSKDISSYAEFDKTEKVSVSNKKSKGYSDTNNLKADLPKVDKGLGIKLSLLTQAVTKETETPADKGGGSDQNEKSELSKKQNLHGLPQDKNSVLFKTNQNFHLNNNAPCHCIEQKHNGDSFNTLATGGYNDESHDRTMSNEQHSPSGPPSKPNYFNKSPFATVDHTSRMDFPNETFSGSMELNSNSFPSFQNILKYDTYDTTNVANELFEHAKMTKTDSASMHVLYSGLSTSLDRQPADTYSPAVSFTYQHTVNTQHSVNTPLTNSSSICVGREFMSSRRQPMENDDRGA